MPIEPKFSVIVPSHNRAHLLGRCIVSILAQSHPDFELIIVDDGSTDNTTETVTAFEDSRIKYFKQPHGERSRARNFGISKATGDYICFVDDDDYLFVNHLQTFYKYLEGKGFPKEILRTGFYREQAKKRHLTANYDRTKHLNPVRFLAYHMCAVGTLCIPRVCLDTDRFPEEFWHYQDTHLFMRLLAKHPFQQLNAHTYIYVIHADMGSRFTNEAFKQRAENNIAAIEDLFDRYGPELNTFLPSGTAEYLVAEKSLQHCARALLMGKYDLSIHFLRKANKHRSTFANLLSVAKKIPGQIRLNAEISNSK